MTKLNAPAVAKSPNSTKYGPLNPSRRWTVSGIRKCRSEYPWPWAWLRRLTGSPSMKSATTVP